MGAWYFLAKGEPCGPLTDDAMQQLLAVGFLRPADLVWQEPMAGWQAIEDCSKLHAADTPPRTSQATPPPLPPRGTPGRNLLPLAAAICLLNCLLAIATFFALPFSLASVVAAKSANDAKHWGDYAASRVQARRATIYLALAVAVMALLLSGWVFIPDNH